MPEEYAAVAVPLPLAGPLTYRIPEDLGIEAQVGCRARVRVGKRRLTGVIVGLSAEKPDLARILPIEALLDRAPILAADTLELGRFVSEYYLSPIGETLKTLYPRQLSAWGDRRVRLTPKGAFSSGGEAAEAQVREALLEGGAQRVSELARVLGDPSALAALEPLQERGWITLEGSRRTGSRYRAAVELPAGDRDRQLEAVGRSPKGRQVIEYLAEVERPATVEELTRLLSCGPGVIRSLVKKGLLRSFTQMERLSLDRHRLERRGTPDFELNGQQARAVAEISEAIARSAYKGFLLKGLTSSGKTEVYLRSIEATLEQGRNAIVLVPEISLVPALAAQAQSRFGTSLAILHSGLSASERAQEWERVRAGTARVVLGPRSAILAPVQRLGLVVVDEEQDASFKQDSVPRYNGRDVALVRARMADAVALLVSATPSLETRYNVERGKLEMLPLTERVGSGRLPEGIVVDLRTEKGKPRRPGEVRFSERLHDELKDALGRGEQVILLRNRRGYSPVLLCRSCGERQECDQCGLPRTYHRREGRMLCHYCGSATAVPERCASCSEKAFDPIGAGTERVEESFRELFPETTVDVLDRDAGRRIGGVASVLQRFADGQTQVLIGTQMVSKGHHFPAVSLTAVLSADSYLSFPDFRAVEKTYSMLTQLGGRAGRGETPGKLVIQTYHPDHYAIQSALHHDDERFADAEMRFRRTFHYPPYTRMVQLLFRGKDRERTEARSRELAKRLDRHPISRECRIAGPAPAPLERLKGSWRFQMLIRHPSSNRLRQLLRETLPEGPHQGLVVDMDPQSLM